MRCGSANLTTARPRPWATAAWSPCGRVAGRRSTRSTPRRWPMAELPRAPPACGCCTTPTSTRPTCGIRTATSSRWSAVVSPAVIHDDNSRPAVVLARHTLVPSSRYNPWLHSGYHSSMKAMKTLRLPALLILATISVGMAAAPKPKPTPLPAIDIPYTKYKLDNGLTLIVHEDHKAPVVAVNIWYHVGSKDERPGRTGFAHLFEHLMFNGSENYKDDWFKVMEAAGATKLNGTTWLDRTNYFQNVPTSALDMTLWMESDRMGHLLGAIDQKVLDEQRGVVQNEKRQRQNQPYGKASEVITQATWPAGHPYSWETIGSMEDLNAASLEDVKDWFRSYYGAANAVIVIAGDVTAADAKARVEKYFGDIAPGPTVNHQKDWVAKMTGERRAVMQDRVPQARIYKVWNIPGYKTRDFSLMDVTADLLATGKNSRLYKRLVYTDRTATAVGAFIGPLEIASQITIFATVKPGEDPAKVEKAMDEEIAALLAKGPTPTELDRIKTSNYAGFARGIERIDGFGGKSYILAESMVYGGSPEFYKTRLGWVSNATPADVQAAAKR